jgi:hypothetical protein
MTAADQRISRRHAGRSVVRLACVAACLALARGARGARGGSLGPQRCGSRRGPAAQVYSEPTAPLTDPVAQISTGGSHHWALDPWVRGAYSYYRVGQANTYGQLAGPAKDASYSPGSTRRSTTSASSTGPSKPVNGPRDSCSAAFALDERSVANEGQTG